MNKNDLIPVIVLALLIPAWIVIDRTFIAPKFPAKTPPAATQPQAEAEATPVAETAETATPPAEAKLTAPKKAPATPKPEKPKAREEVVVLENGKVRLEISSIGGRVKSATLLNYPELNEKGSPPVVLDFSKSAALAYQGIPGLEADDPLVLRKSEDGRSATLSRHWKDGTSFQRTISIGDGYLVSVKDRFANPGSSPWNLPERRIFTGSMENPPAVKARRGLSILGVDSFTPSGDVRYWGRKLHKLYGKPAPLAIDTVPPAMQGVKVDWVSAKNKFFVQILRPAKPLATMSVLSTRDPAAKGIVPKTVAAALNLPKETVAPGQQAETDYTYFIGPKKYSVLKAAGHSMEKVMEFQTIGTFSFMNWLMEPSRKALLWTLNLFHAVVHNYGVAIILLTILVRVLFWPLTHKSTESMQRMKEIQPELKALQEKYKENPQKLQQETMKLYREKKVNPMGGCLPMFVQIPVFIALYTVLRNAIELRYAGFLWISDLSAPENLFAGAVPIVGSLNILPLVMAGSMIWQQKLTPQPAATPEQMQQQKMMTFMMPLMMLFFFYKMPSGLVLYWTTSNLLMILQTSLRNHKKA